MKKPQNATSSSNSWNTKSELRKTKADLRHELSVTKALLELRKDPAEPPAIKLTLRELVNLYRMLAVELSLLKTDRPGDAHSISVCERIHKKVTGSLRTSLDWMESDSERDESKISTWTLTNGN